MSGYDFFPDVFRRVAADGQPGDLTSFVCGILETMRKVWLRNARIPERVPIHITEHRWPTSVGRAVERQAQVIEQVVRTVYAHGERRNIDSYSLFALRDAQAIRADHAADLFSFSGIMTAHYRPRPPFETFRALIQEFG